MRRALGSVLVLGLLVGGAAACSDDDGGDDTATESTTTAATTSTGGDEQETTTTAADDGEQETTTTAAEGGEEETTTTVSEVEAANDAVIQEYCDAVEINNNALRASEAAPDNPTVQDALEAASARLGEASDAVGPLVETFTPEQQAQFEECSDAVGG